MGEFLPEIGRPDRRGPPAARAARCDALPL